MFFLPEVGEFTLNGTNSYRDVPTDSAAFSSLNTSTDHLELRTTKPGMLTIGSEVVRIDLLPPAPGTVPSK